MKKGVLTLPPAEQRAEKEAGKQGLPVRARAARERSRASAARTTGEPTSPDSSGMPRERIPKKTAHTMQRKKMRHEGPKRGPSFWKDPPHGGGSPHSRSPNPNSNGRLTSIHPSNPPEKQPMRSQRRSLGTPNHLWTERLWDNDAASTDRERRTGGCAADSARSPPLKGR